MNPMIQNGRDADIYKIESFYGLNEREKIGMGEFSNLMNLSSDCFPVSCVRKSRQRTELEGIKIVTPCLPKYEKRELDRFTGVGIEISTGNYEFYYNGEKIPRDAGVTISESKKSIVDFNGNICIFPDLLYYSYLPDSSGQLSKMAKSRYESRQCKFQTVKKGDVVEYSTITANAGNWDLFKSGDGISIFGSSVKNNNTLLANSRYQSASDSDILSVVVDKVQGNVLTCHCYNKAGKEVGFTNTSSYEAVTVEIAMPEMQYACINNNRIWATDKKGEYLYACKLGDCFNWNVYAGLSTDSWWAQVASYGEFTGIAAYRGNVVAFKENFIHEIFGDKPSNFQIPYTIDRGCIDGGSIAQQGGVLFFLSSDGFYAYTGSEPQKISGNIKTKYADVTAASDREKYYVSAKREDNDTRELLVFDPVHKLWHKEEDDGFLSMLFWNNVLYGFTQDKIVAFGKGNEVISWHFETGYLTLGQMQDKTVNNLWIRAFMPKDSSMKVTVITGEKEDGFETSITNQADDRLLAFRAPSQITPWNNFKIRIEGTGNIHIWDINFSAAFRGKN